MIKFRCNCEKKIGVPDEYAGKKVRCPACGTTSIVPFAAEPKIIEPAPAKPRPDTYSLSNDDDRSSIWSDDLLEQTQPVADIEKNTCPECGFKVSANRDTCPSCHYSFVPDVSTVVPVNAPRGVSPFKRFVADTLKVLSPIGSVGDILTLAIATAIYLLPILLRYSSIYGLYGSFIIQGYFCTYMFHIMLETANGEMRLPNLPFSEIEEIREPFFRFFVSFVYACLPITLALFGVFYWLNDMEEISDIIDRAVEFGVPIGLFFWPMTALTFALGETVLVRPDKVVLSIIRTIGPYLVCCIILYLAYYLSFVAVGQLSGLLLGDEPSIENIIAINILFSIAGLLSQICAMRIIGVFYKHYKDHIDW